MARLRAEVTVEADKSVEELLELLKDVPGEAAKALVAGVNEGAQEIVGLAVKERFRGKGPFPVAQKRLGVVTRRLSRSLRASKAKVLSRGLVQVAMGSNVKYFGAHEFGRTGKEQVKSHRVKEHEVRNAFGRGQTVTRKAHTRKAFQRRVKVPKREPLQATIREHAVRVFGNTIERQLGSLLEGGVS